MPAKKTRKPSQQTRKDQPACGLCGKTKNLTKTECCGKWICDDEHEYVMFSYARNSCHRNHRRYTLCGVHHAEGHKGSWQVCPHCRDAFETEMYVSYGTSEYNFETLSNPPAYEPTHCHQCGRVIVLGDGGYSLSGGNYFCGPCTANTTGRELRLLENDDPEPADDLTPEPGVLDRANPGELVVTGDLQEFRAQVPDAYRDRFDGIAERTDVFCDRHLNGEYKQLAREMAAAICQSGSPVLKGNAQSWAAGIIYALGQVNFLTDPSQTPHMKSEEIAHGFGVSPATMQAKARIIREGLELIPLDPEWSLPSRMDDNPLVWMLEVNGMLMDIRMAPHDVQVAAYEQGLIPYIPAARDRS